MTASLQVFHSQGHLYHSCGLPHITVKVNCIRGSSENAPLHIVTWDRHTSTSGGAMLS